MTPHSLTHVIPFAFDRVRSVLLTAGLPYHPRPLKTHELPFQLLADFFYIFMILFSNERSVNGPYRREIFSLLCSGPLSSEQNPVILNPPRTHAGISLAWFSFDLLSHPLVPSWGLHVEPSFSPAPLFPFLTC